MKVWNHELTGSQSAAVRFALRLLYFLLSLAIVFLFYRPPGVVVILLIGAVVYLSFVGLALEHWKLRRPETSPATMHWVATLATLPMLAAFPIVIFMFR